MSYVYLAISAHSLLLPLVCELRMRALDWRTIRPWLLVHTVGWPELAVLRHSVQRSIEGQLRDTWVSRDTRRLLHPARHVFGHLSEY
jgi:hypothetical protein